MPQTLQHQQAPSRPGLEGKELTNIYNIGYNVLIRNYLKGGTLTWIDLQIGSK